jgi:hypothetical protein
MFFISLRKRVDGYKIQIQKMLKENKTIREMSNLGRISFLVQTAHAEP